MMLKTLISRQSLNPSFWGNNLVVVSGVLEPRDHCLSSLGFFPPGIRKILSFFFFFLIFLKFVAQLRVPWRDESGLLA